MVNSGEKKILFRPAKEVFKQFKPDDVCKHVDAAHLLMPLAVPPEVEFLRAYAACLEGKPYKAEAEDNPKAVKRGSEAARQRLPITTALRDLQSFLIASYRGSFKSEAKTESLRANARRPRKRQTDPRRLRQPLTLSAVEMELVKQTVEKTGAEMSNFIREKVLNVCSGVVPFTAPPVVQAGGRNIQYQVRWSESEWAAVSKKAEECYGISAGKRGYTGILVRDIILTSVKEILETR